MQFVSGDLVSAKLALFVSTGAIALCASAASGQETGRTATTEGSATQAGANDQKADDGAEIIVTAKNREQRLQEVPLAITTFNETSLRERNILDARDVAQFTPSFNFYSGTGRSDPTALAVRGLAPNTSDERYQGLTIFIDGIALSGQAVGVDLSQLERVEVIKGPQSATFGRATYSGAINYITKNPSSNEITGHARARGSMSDGSPGRSGASYYAGGRLDVPVLPDRMWVSINGLVRQEGAVSFDPGDGSPIGRERTRGGAATLFVKPATGLSLKLYANYTKEEDTPSAIQNMHPREWLQAGVPTVALPRGPFALWPTRVPEARVDVTGGRFLAGANPDTAQRTRNRLLTTALARLDIAGSELSYRGGYFRQNIRVNEDFLYRSILTDADPVFGPLVRSGAATVTPIAATVVSATQERFRNMSHQLLLVSPGQDRFRWQAGVYYFDEESDNFEVPVRATPANPDARARGTERIRNKAVFGGISVDVTNALTIDAEARYQSENSSVATCTICRFITPEPLESKETAFLPRLTAQYKLTPNNFLYALYAHGQKGARLTFESSDLNRDGRISDNEVTSFIARPEKLNNYEIGLKNSFFGGRGILNLAAFLQKVKDQQLITQEQVTRGDGSFGVISGVRNVGGSDIWGFEVEGQAAASRYLSFSGGVGYAKQRFTNPNPIIISAASAVFFPDPRGNGSVILDGKAQANVPRLTGNASAMLNIPVGRGWDGALRADAIYRGPFFADLGNIATVEGSWKLNLRAAASKGGVELAAFARNLLNDQTITGAFLAGGAYFCAFRESNVAVYGTGAAQRCMFAGVPRPREMGLEASFRF
jgi:outer membrane receptor protein involved in Fe transport